MTSQEPNPSAVLCTATFGVTGASDFATNTLMTGTFTGLPSGVHLYVLSLGVGFQSSDLELTLSGPPLAAPQTLSAELYPYNPFVETRVSFYVNVPATQGQNSLDFRLSVKPTPDGTGRGGFVHHAQLTRQD